MQSPHLQCSGRQQRFSRFPSILLRDQEYLQDVRILNIYMIFIPYSVNNGNRKQTSVFLNLWDFESDF